MLNKVKLLIDKYQLLENCSSVTVGLSGGADSVCLLYVLNELKDEYKFDLSAIHINHQLRGDESERDQTFVQNICASLNIPLNVLRVDVLTYAKETGESIELAARNLRYKLFKENAKGFVATAHNLGDNLETVLLNLTRGTGVKGLAGIPVKRDIFIRPLLSVSRFEIEEFLSSKSISFVTDSTNLEDEFSRNIIRHNVLPVLKKLNPSLEHTVFNMTENIKEDSAFLENISYKQFLLCSKSNGLDSELLLVQDRAISKRVLAFYFNERLGILPDSIHINRMFEVLTLGGKKSLPKNSFCENKGGLFVISFDENQKCEVNFNVELKQTSKINKLFLNNTIDCDKINGSLVVRNRIGGDKIRLKTRNCTKSLKKLYCEMKLEPFLRDSVPVVADNDGVVWAFGAGVDARAAADENTKNAIEIYVNETVDTDS